VERIWRATINSWNGLVAVTRSEAAFRQELGLLAIGIPLAFFLTSDITKRFALIGVIVRKGSEAGVHTPASAALYALMKAIDTRG